MLNQMKKQFFCIMCRYEIVCLSNDKLVFDKVQKAHILLSTTVDA